MGFKDMLRNTMLADYGRRIKNAPREVITSPLLLLSCAMYATAAIPLSKPTASHAVFSNHTDHYIQHGIKDRRLLYLLWRAFNNNLALAPQLGLTRLEISSLLCTSAMLPVLLYRSSSMIGLEDFGPTGYTVPFGSLDS